MTRFAFIALALAAAAPAFASQWNDAAEKQIAHRCGLYAGIDRAVYQDCRRKTIHDQHLDAPDAFPVPDEPVTVIRGRRD